MGQMLSWPDVSDKSFSSTDIFGTVVAMSYVLVILFWLLFVCFYSFYIDHREPKNTVTNYAASRSTGTELPPEDTSSLRS
ncbi:hypothetical protein B9Z55_027671 [Caenorhabditis nigoni]|uniref:Uncharacterized protein n=1 Tax=Caenorhabditis nigoni TaxID=1611254 RepID=A0A2G5SER5_9PELO|nr:hypothetical protein B9Z55_027671 [Caenorhabditis nigoni]